MLLFVKHVVLTVVALFNLVSLSFSPSSFHLLLPPLSFTDATKKITSLPFQTLSVTLTIFFSMTLTF